MMGEEAEIFYHNVLIAADMVASLEDREVIYAAVRAAKIATTDGENPRKMFHRQSRKFPHIKLDMSYKNWHE